MGRSRQARQYRGWIAASQRKEELEAWLKQLRLEQKLLSAAKTLSGIHQIEEEIARLEKQTESARKGLQTFEKDARFNGALFRAALERTKADLINTTARLAQNIVEQTQLREEARKTILDLIKTEMHKSAELEVLRREQTNYEQEIKVFVEKGWLQQADEQISSALEWANGLLEEQVIHAEQCKVSLEEWEKSHASTAAGLEAARKSETVVSLALKQHGVPSEL